MKKVKINITKKQAVAISVGATVIGGGIIWWKLPVSKEVKKDILDRIGDYCVREIVRLGYGFYYYTAVTNTFYNKNKISFDEIIEILEKIGVERK